MEKSDEVVDAQAHVWNYLFKFINTMALKCAVELGIPQVIHNHGKPMTLPRLLSALSINAAKSQHLYRLMRLLVHSNFFVKLNMVDEDAAYWLTPASSLLLVHHESFCLTPLLKVVVGPIMQDPWHHVTQWLSSRDDDRHSAFETAHGMPFWEYAERVPSLNDLFNEAMASDSRLVSHVLLARSKDVFRGFESLVDVGGGTGATAKAIAGDFPEMACIVLDLPHVVSGLEGTNNLSYVAGDMFEAIPPAHLLLLKSILHDWNDEESVRILKKCKDAIGRCSKKKGCGKVIVIEMVLNNYMHGGGDKALEDQLLYDMAMMTYLNGKERTEQEWANIFSDAGFTSYKIRAQLGVRSLIEVYP